MSVLTVVQEALSELGLERRPAAIYGVDDDTEIELIDIIHDVAQSIADGYSWQALSRRYTYTGDGSTEDFDLPPYFDGLPSGMQVWTTRLQYPLRRVPDLDAWEEISIRNYDYVSGVWTVYNNQLHIRPAPAATETVSFYYRDRRYAISSTGSTLKAEFDDDSDEFRLPERLLKLGLVWRYRSMKGLPYEENLATYNEALAQEIHKDRLPQVITLNRARGFRGVKRAYPNTLT